MNKFLIIGTIIAIIGLIFLCIAVIDETNNKDKYTIAKCYDNANNEILNIECKIKYESKYKDISLLFLFFTSIFIVAGAINTLEN